MDRTGIICYIYIWGWKQISTPLIDVQSANCLYLQKSSEFLNQVLKVWSKFQKKHFYVRLPKIRNMCRFTNRSYSLLHVICEFPDMTEAYSEPFQTSKMELFAFIYFRKEFHLICLTDSKYTSAWHEVESEIALTLVTWLFLNFS